jgi:hypothetical protein
MALNPYTITEWNSEIIKFQQPEKYKDNLRSFTEMPLTFRMSKQALTEKIHCSGTWYYIDISVEDDSKLVDFFKTLDEYIIETVYSNRMEWFNQDIPKEMIRSFYEPCLRGDNTLRVKVPAVNKVPDVPLCILSLFEKDEDILSEESSTKVSSLEQYENKPVSFLIDISSLRFLKNKCSCEFKLKFVSVRDVDSKREGFTVDTEDAVNQEKEMKRLQQHQMLLEVKKSVEEQLDDLVKKQEELKEKYNMVMEEEKKLLSANDIDDNFELTFYNRIAI